MKFLQGYRLNTVMYSGMTAILTMVLLMATPVSADSGNPNPKVKPAYAYPVGQSYGEWSAAWWQWHLALPATNHPVLSEDGANCGTGQSGNVWFLTGAIPTTLPDFRVVERDSCVVPMGKHIFFPILNVACTTLFGELIPEGPGSNVDTCAAELIDGTLLLATDLSVTIDGVPLVNPEAFRFQSPVFDFGFEDPGDNIIGVDCSAEDCSNPQGVSDGFWVMLAPLSRGSHVINFTGNFRDLFGEIFFGLDVTYNLTVTPGR